MLSVGDVQRAIDWHQSLGFEVMATNLDWESGPVNWANLKRGNAELMLTASEDGGGRGVTLYFRTNDVDAFYEEIKERVEVRYQPTDQFYGQRDFAIDSPDGYMLVFGQALAQTDDS